MKIITKLLAILDGMKEAGSLVEVIYNTPSMSNVSMSAAKMPCAVLYCVTDWSVDISTRVSHETAEINLFFLTRQPAISADGRKNDEFISQMADLATAFIGDLFAEDTIEIDGDSYKMQSVFNMGDTNATGIRLELSIRDIQGSCI